MKLVIIGGHLSPALSVIEELPKNTEILFVGRKHAFEGDKTQSLEYQTISSLKIPYAAITAGRLQRKFTRHTINALLKFPIGLIQSFFVLLKFKPDVVVGFGGYVSLPVAIAAFLLKAPVVIHEQTLEAGFSNKIISIFAKKVCISWNSSSRFFPKEKTVLTGNPIRKFDPPNQRTKFEIKTVDKNLPVIYITGGSSGSHFINNLVEGCIVDLLKKYNVIHQTGDSKFGDFDRLAVISKNLPDSIRRRYILKKFVEPSHVGSILENCDLTIARAGINTITELISFEKPTLLIPLPISQNNEQLKNARFLEKLKLGKVLHQDEIDSKKLYEEVVSMFGNIEKYRLDKSEPDDLQISQAAKNIVKIIEYVGRTKKGSKL